MRDPASDKPEGPRTEAHLDSVCLEKKWISPGSWLCRPRGLVLWICCYSFIQSMISNAFVPASVSSLERRFRMSSTTASFISFVQDCTGICALPLISYYGGRGHRPRLLGAALLLLSLGALLFAMPHFLAGTYTISGLASPFPLCDASNPAVTESCSANSLLAFFFVGQAIMAFASVSLYTLAPSLLDDNVHQGPLSIYFGLLWSMSALGPAIGFVLAGVFLDLWVDPGEQPAGVNPDSPQWVGAWWIGFLLASGLAFFCAIPFFFYGRHLPHTEHIRAAKPLSPDIVRTPTHLCATGGAPSNGEGSSIRPMVQSQASISTLEVPALSVSRETSGGQNEPGQQEQNAPRATRHLAYWPIFRSLLENRPFIFSSLAISCEAFTISGFAFFLVKIVQSVFSLTAAMSSIVMGILVVVGVAFGTYLGGWLVSRFQWSAVTSAKANVYFSALSLLFVMGFLASCDQIAIAGVTAVYRNATGSGLEGAANVVLDAPCNADCSCPSSVYNPVCGSDGVSYVSPCYAGCSASAVDSVTGPFSSCSCISESGDGTADEGKCTTHCALLPVFIINLFFAMLLTFLNSVPATTVVVRCLPVEQRPVGLGVREILWRAIGAIPGPVVFGAALDDACVLWADRCGDKGSCHEYNNDELRVSFMLLALVPKSVALVLYVLCWRAYVKHVKQTERISAIAGEQMML